MNTQTHVRLLMPLVLTLAFSLQPSAFLQAAPLGTAFTYQGRLTDGVAFGLGTDDKHIATVDADGVALAAIHGLNQKLEAAVQAKDARIAELERRLAALERILNPTNK